MARKKIVLDGWKDQIEQWAKDGLRIQEIQRRLQDEAKVTIAASTLATQFRSWGIRYHRPPIKKSDELRERVKELFHTRSTMRDHEMVLLLQSEGFQISGTRALARLRREGGLFKRVEKEQEEKTKEEIIKALRQEFGDNFELPDDLGTRNLSVYLRSKYNLVGRDRIRRIASEINPEWVQRRRQKGRFPHLPATTVEAGEEPSSTALNEREIQTGASQALPAQGGYSHHSAEPPVPSRKAAMARHRALHYGASSSQQLTRGLSIAPEWLDPNLLDTG